MDYVSLNSQLRIYTPLYHIIKEGVLIGLTNERMSKYLGLTVSFINSVRRHLAENNEIPNRFYGSRDFKYKKKSYVAQLRNGEEKKIEPIQSLVWGVSPRYPKIDPTYFLLPEFSCFWAIRDNSVDFLSDLIRKYRTSSPKQLKRLCNIRIYTKKVELEPITEDQKKTMIVFLRMYTNSRFINKITEFRNNYQNPNSPNRCTDANKFRENFELLSEIGIGLDKNKIQKKLDFTEFATPATPAAPATLIVSSNLVVTETELEETIPTTPKEEIVIDVVDSQAYKVLLEEADEHAIIADTDMKQEEEYHDIATLAEEIARQEKQEPLSLVYNGLKITFLIDNKEVVIKPNSIEIK